MVNDPTLTFAFFNSLPHGLFINNNGQHCILLDLLLVLLDLVSIDTVLMNTPEFLLTPYVVQYSIKPITISILQMTYFITSEGKNYLEKFETDR
jgi:hypothetical protein